MQEVASEIGKMQKMASEDSEYARSGFGDWENAKNGVGGCGICKKWLRRLGKWRRKKLHSSYSEYAIHSARHLSAFRLFHPLFVFFCGT